jgi:MFS family permease
MRAGKTSIAAHPKLVLAMLLLVYIFNFLDRQLLGILAAPIKLDIGLTDTQFGAIGGLAFALLYSTLGVPLAYLADRTSRSWVITGALCAWSGFTASCGMATSYWQLFVARLGVGCGEAGGVAPSYALIAEYFPPEHRAKALSTFSLGIPIGLSFGTLLGAYIALWFDWRTAFIAMGVVGIIVAPLFKFIVRDRPAAAMPVAATADVAPAQAFRIVARIPAFWLMAVSAGFSSLCGYGLALWVPSVLIRSFHMELMDAAYFVGFAVLIGGCIGVMGGGWLADRLGARDRGWYVKLPAIAWLITAPTYAIGLLVPNVPLAWLILLIPNALNIFWIGPVTTAVQHLVPAPMRATASGSFLFINNLIGLGAGPLLMGFLSDQLHGRFGDEALRLSVLMCLSFYVLAALLASLAVRSLRTAWRDDYGPADQVPALGEEPGRPALAGA